MQFNNSGSGAVAQLGIEVAEWFVHQKHRRLTGHGAAQGHPLFLATRKLLGSAVQKRCQLQRFRHRGDPLLNLLLAAGANLQWGRQVAAESVQLILQLLPGGSGLASSQPEAEVLSNAQVGIEGIALEHHCHIPPAGADLAHGSAADPDLTGRWRLKACQQAQQGAFATS